MSPGFMPPWLDSHAIALGISILLTALCQMMLKTGASGKAKWIGSFLNRRTILGYGMFVLVTLLTVYAMQRIALKTMTAWNALTFILVVVFSRWLLGENVDRFRMAGCALIVAGILVFSLPAAG